MAAIDADTRKLLKQQFAKADRNRDARLELDEFLSAFEACKIILPNLHGVSHSTAQANFSLHQQSGSIDINGFFRIIAKLNGGNAKHGGDSRVMINMRGAGHQAPAAGSAAAAPLSSSASSSSSSLVPVPVPVPVKPPAHSPPAEHPNLYTTLKKGAKDTARSVGQWFGVAGDPEVLHQQYLRSKQQPEPERVQVVARGPAPSANGKSKYAQFGPLAPGLQRSKSKRRSTTTAPAAGGSPLRTISGATLVTGVHEGMAVYDAFLKREREQIRMQMEQEMQREKEAAETGAANGHRSASKPKKKHKPKMSKEMQQLYIQAQLNALPTFSPWFTRVITFIQLVVLLFMVAYAYRDNRIAPLGLGPSETTCSVSPVSDPPCPTTFQCDSVCYDTAAVRSQGTNMWIGPDEEYILQLGAKFTPCMRRDREIKLRLDNERQVLECGGNGVPCEGGGYINNQGASCCRVANSTFGTVTKAVCDSFQGDWLESGGENFKCSESLTVVVRPCCLGLQGKCEVLTQSQCDYRLGVWHRDQQLCSDVMCLGHICENNLGLGELQASSTDRNQPRSVSQWFRFISPLFLHAGVLHFLPVLLVQWTVGKQIEKTAGALRTSLIYFISGIGGWVISGIFSPYTVDVGADPAVFGFLGVLFVELFQSWQLVERAKMELLKLTAVLAVALLLGTMPYVDNWSHLGGFFLGMLSAVVFLPYITFGKWDLRRKQILLLICAPLLLATVIMSFIVFYVIQTTEFCSWCHHLNCIEYTSSLSCSR
eukprot:m.244289 g.244289  ORF g.244289 m.244289 type:complete len:766 (-) comp22558_c1_seq6:32-2329(-)